MLSGASPKAGEAKHLVFVRSDWTLPSRQEVRWMAITRIDTLIRPRAANNAFCSDSS